MDIFNAIAQNIDNYIGILTALVAVISGAYYFFQKKREGWGWSFLLLGIIALLVKEIMGAFIKVPHDQILSGTVPLNHIPLAEQGNNHLVDIFGEIVISVGFWRLFIVEQRQRKRKIDQLEKQVAGFTSLSHSMLGINESLQFSSVLENVAKEALHLLDADCSIITSIQEDGSRQVVHAFNPQVYSSKAGQSKPDFIRFIDWMQEQGDSIAIENLEKSPYAENLRMLIPPGFQALIGMPVYIEDKPTGIILLAFQKSKVFTQLDREMLKLFANQAALAIKNSSLYQKVEFLSLIDPLTGLANRRAYDQRIIEEIHRARRYQRLLSVVMVDIDHFKDVNDQFGHPAGDRTIKNVANILKTDLREVDFTARLGGEEFILILPETSGREAYLIAERVRKQINDSSIQAAGKKVSVTASMGVVSYLGNETPANPKEIYKQVDQVLYKAKNLGRDRVCASP